MEGMNFLKKCLQSNSGIFLSGGIGMELNSKSNSFRFEYLVRSRWFSA